VAPVEEVIYSPADREVRDVQSMTFAYKSADIHGVSG